jgi:macrolide transport system ATP-binding/permease protein
MIQLCYDRFLYRKAGKRIVELLHSLTLDGRTVIIATHDSDIADKADRVMEMTDGKVTASYAA